jgi:hypothetical protein
MASSDFLAMATSGTDDGPRGGDLERCVEAKLRDKREGTTSFTQKDFDFIGFILLLIFIFIPASLRSTMGIPWGHQ